MGVPVAETQTPRAVTGRPPSNVTAPPSTAVVTSTLDASAEVTVGTESAPSVVNVCSSP